eukprot:31426-Pelagococcus_subviridis.AAC.8
MGEIRLQRRTHPKIVLRTRTGANDRTGADAARSRHLTTRLIKTRRRRARTPARAAARVLATFGRLARAPALLRRLRAPRGAAARPRRLASSLAPRRIRAASRRAAGRAPPRTAVRTRRIHPTARRPRTPRSPTPPPPPH